MHKKITKKPLISIVDDDESVREGTMDLVRSMGFVAKASHDSTATLFLIARNPNLSWCAAVVYFDKIVKGRIDDHQNQ